MGRIVPLPGYDEFYILDYIIVFIIPFCIRFFDSGDFRFAANASENAQYAGTNE